MKTMNASIITGCLLLGVMMNVGCGQVLKKDGPNGQTNVNQVSLERDFQEVIHHDCLGKVTQDGIETVSPPTAWVQINPNNPSIVTDWTFKDEQTGSSPSLISGKYSFQVDYSYGFFNMHVLSGINTIDYTFSHCTTWTTDANGNSVCTAHQTDEQGTVTINVNYTEKTLGGSLSVSDCQPSPSPSPSPH